MGRQNVVTPLYLGLLEVETSRCASTMLVILLENEIKVRCSDFGTDRRVCISETKRMSHEPF